MTQTDDPSRGLPADIDLSDLLQRGWVIEGFDVAMMAAGATAKYILLRHGTHVGTFTLVENGRKELGRGFNLISPQKASAPTPEDEAPRRGFWG